MGAAFRAEVNQKYEDMKHMTEEQLNCFATAAFGLEGLVAAELKRLGIQQVRAENGGVRFQASVEEIMLCNLRLRFCDRVFLLLAEQRCTSFEELFQLNLGISWQHFLKGNEQILVSAKCARSRLMSPRDCQSITKKAIIEKLRATKSMTVFPETGNRFPVLISIHQDQVRVLLNTSGEALSRRGYRTWNGEAPLRETLASALVELSPWRPGMALHDPCCGTGTLLIEAAFRAAHRAPGLQRSFAMEGFAFVSAASCATVRARCQAEMDPDRVQHISGSDIDAGALELAERHLKQAGLSGRIPLRQMDLKELTLEEEGGTFLCNPPYGERLSEQRICRGLYRELNALQRRHPTWSLCAISSDPGFEKAFGRHADKKRRLYNGRLECNFYIYRPLRSNSIHS